MNIEKINLLKDCITSVDGIIKLQEEKLELLRKHKKGLEQFLEEENKKVHNN